MTQQQKALEILRAMAEAGAAGKSLTISDDLGFWSGTLIDQDGSHTHFGCDYCENEEKNFEAFVNGLHGLLVEQRGLSWVSASNAGLGFPPILDACCGGRQFWFDKENPNVLFADWRVMPPKVLWRRDAA